MLTQLCIDNFALAQSLELDFSGGMTAITGETGAGKSLTLEALATITGGRADVNMIRNGSEQAELHARFDLSDSPQARQWLQQQAIGGDDECLLRRIISRSGRTKAYINGKPVSVKQLKELGEQLLDIHSQNQHYSLLKRDTQRELLDNFAAQQPLLLQLQGAYQQLQEAQQQLQLRHDNAGEQSAREQLLRYQSAELNQLALEEDELEALESEQSQLANAEETLTACYHSQQLCDSGDNSLLNQLHQASSSLLAVTGEDEQLGEAIELLSNAQILVSEASSAIASHIERQPLDPARLQWVEERLSLIYQTARKHRIQPQQLPALALELNAELELLDSDDNQLEQLEQQIATLQKSYDKLATKISRQRRSAGKKLQQLANQQLAALSMEHCKINFAFTPCDRGPAGKEIVELLVSTNPGQEPQLISKVASGGELSRISLAISVVSSHQQAAGTRIFDEVDVGIGGGVAEIVGRLLRELGQHSQVLCITHLPQVASQAHQHLQASKSTDGDGAKTAIHNLADTQRVDEIARMLGGIVITPQSRAHAQEMLRLEQA
ncbi:DNA replication and repair protein RecN [Sinobacterium caligoides]|uniref:DNA repair protein RecN n=1 Tax=Sinobacterium caligoides TaxID=933926 RepID=A0A3N2DFZ7_9GAMM|nr:DNA repair protein RecN [Sinobacterium caligoides]ROR98659.1 DNA replication and repair protein RecN [Sinobacterium caligoides]